MSPIQGSFDASQFAPKQSGGAHPIGNGYDAIISNTTIQPTKDNSGGMFCVEFTTQAGSIVNRYNLWNNSEKAVEIARGELSALCHATGIYKLDFNNDGAALRNARCKIDVGLQNVSEPDGYVEIKKVYDANGNEPGKTNAAPQPQGGPAPMQQQPNGGWGTPNPNPTAQPQPQPQPNSAPTWGNPNPNSAPNNNPAPNSPTPNNPPWGGNR